MIWECAECWEGNTKARWIEEAGRPVRRPRLLPSWRAVTLLGSGVGSGWSEVAGLEILWRLVMVTCEGLDIAVKGGEASR